MITFYIIGVVIVLLAALIILVWSIVDEETDTLGIYVIVIISLFSWLSMFIMVIAAIFLNIKE